MHRFSPWRCLLNHYYSFEYPGEDTKKKKLERVLTIQFWKVSALGIMGSYRQVNCALSRKR